jgi:hypothetical protein
METQKRAREHLSVEIQPTDRKRLEEVAEKLGLNMSEIVRRAMRIGLARFEKIRLPGGEIRAGE